ncbi:MAG TPA: methyltransferase domain-containing protein [Nocardioidaceae bacterium]|nr:methyltransferase domain-containing protein [Nocardioidaceae bacterium]
MFTDRTPQQLLAEVYDAGAAAYARYWAPALHRHAVDLVAAVPPPAPSTSRTVVDVATGSGALIPALSDLAGERGRVIALDRSLGMLHQAPATHPRVQADAAALPLHDARVDVLVLAFVLFLLPDARQAVAEAARVLRPGGWLLAATWGDQVGTNADVVVREELDAVGAPEFPTLARSDSITDSPDRMASLLENAFTEIHTWGRALEARFDRRSALAMRTGCGALGWRYAQLDPATREVVSARAVERLGSLPPEGFVDLSEVLLTTARRR